MKSTGEVYGSDTRADVAYLKARLATEIPVAKEGGLTSPLEMRTRKH